MTTAAADRYRKRTASQLGSWRLVALSVFALLLLVLPAHIARGQIAQKAEPPLRLTAPEFPPYMAETAGHRVSGHAIDLVDQVAKVAGLEWHYRPVPTFARAIEDIRQNEADGLVAGTRNAERDALATFFGPLFEARRSWFFLTENTFDPADPSFKNQARLGALANSTIHLWLVDQGYNVSQLVPGPKNLVLSLRDRRIDGTLLSDLVMEAALLETKIPLSSVRAIKQEDQQFGIYLSHKVLQQRPGLAAKMAEAVQIVYRKTPKKISAW